ncbi:seminal metalloprotease 1-like [Arctopsyche grandis]|uniref:seminal metalloprotease 1-like n=1 Tax=Arctopsyche grandis TaxID=121162 RepID=UPI00406D6CE3
MVEFNEYLKVTNESEPDEEFDELADNGQNIWERSGKFEGDIILSDKQRQVLLEEVSTPGLARNGLNDVSKRWPRKTLVYEIGDDFSSDQVSAIKDAMSDLERSSCVKFKEKGPNDDDYVKIQGARRGCFSQVGYQGRGKQLLNLTPHPSGLGCMRHGTIVHELLHSLGFFHMQSHTKRDKYVKIVWDNILDGRENNFKKYNSFVTTDFGVPYDYDSVLHYSAFAFSKNGRKTIVPLQDNFGTIGQRTGLSDKDTLKLNRMYQCGSSSYDAPEDDGKYINSDEEDFSFPWAKYQEENSPDEHYEFESWWNK